MELQPLKPHNGDRTKGVADKQRSDDYDPYDHRERETPTNDWDTLAHLIKGAIGTGILALPEGFYFTGMINGIISTFLIGILCTYCYHMLARAQYVLCKKMRVGLLTYPESLKVAFELGPECFRRFAPAAPLIVDIFLMIYQFGTCCVYIVFVAVNLKSVADVYSASKTHLVFFFLACYIPFLIILSVRNLKLFAPLSVVANIISFVTVGVVAYYVSQSLVPFNSRPSFGNISQYPLYFGTTLFALQAVGVTVAAENNMKNPRSYRKPLGVLNIAMFVVTIIYIIFGMMGYWKYGSEIESSITLNFPPKDILGQVIKVLYSLAIYISYGLQGFVGFDILWTNHLVSHFENVTENRKLFYEYLIRFAIVTVTFFLATAIPLLGLFISLVGCFCLSCLGIAFPAIMEICAYWPDQLGVGKIRLWKDIVFIVIGIVGLLTGTYSCILAIVTELSKLYSR